MIEPVVSMRSRALRAGLEVWIAAVLLVAVMTGSSLPASQASQIEAQAAVSESVVWLGPDGQILPFQKDEEIEEFLSSAEVVATDAIPRGVNKPYRLTLEKDGIRARAIFRDVSIKKQSWMDPKRGPQLNFRDDCVFECAAYEVSRMLGLHCVPPVVSRKISGNNLPRGIRGKKGTLQIWVENAKLERERQEEGTQSPDPRGWLVQMQTMRVFDSLIHNDDRTQENMLIDVNWKLWLIDHTRAFRRYKEAPDLRMIRYCEKTLWERLNQMDDLILRARLKPFLNSGEIEALLSRKVQVVEFIQGLIDEQGESKIIISLH